jgi:purine nucleosidase
MRLIIDTDAGIDDSQAILMALAAPHARVEAITTVTGNVHVDNVNRNVFTILDICKMNIPVFAGADRPLVAAWGGAIEDIHGRDGLGDWSERPQTMVRLQPLHAALAIVNMVNQAPGEYTLVALGPLTNIALAVRLDPELPRKVRNFVFMGGTISAQGNTDTVTAEYNIYCDPEAAHVVLGAFEQSTMLSWEATMMHPLTWEQLAAVRDARTPVGAFVRGTTEKLLRMFQGVNSPGYMIPDPLAMAVALHPEAVLQSDFRFTTVELHGGYTRGQTVIDYRMDSQATPNVHLITRLDMDQVFGAFHRMATIG